ncbi:MAG: thiaminase II [Syntrophobacterales bacterium]|nr:MAG: thiaminase II [Syntrophobacterales bacterium]
MKFTDTLRKKAHAIWEANFDHPFVQGIGDGSLDEEKFKFYLAQDYVYLKDFCRFLAIAAAKSHDLGSMGRFSGLLGLTLKVEMDLHRSICGDFGISAEELEKTEPAPYCLAYSSYLLRIAYEGDFLDLLAAFLPCEWGYVEIGARLQARGIPEHPHYAKWIETYASAEFRELTERTKDLLNELTRGAPKEKLDRLQEIFNFSSRWERLFWEMAWNRQRWIA